MREGSYCGLDTNVDIWVDLILDLIPHILLHRFVFWVNIVGSKARKLEVESLGFEYDLALNLHMVVRPCPFLFC